MTRRLQEEIAELHAEKQRLQKRLEECERDLKELAGDDVRRKPVPACDWVREDLGDVEWIVGGILTKGSISMLSSFPGLGKSTLVQQLGICLTNDLPFVGLATATGQKVLYVAAEGARTAIRSRYIRACQSMKVDPSSQKFFIQPRDLTDYQIGAPGLEEMIDTERPDLVILDTIQYFYRGDENASSDWKRYVMQPLDKLVKSYGCTFLMIHHLRKRQFSRNGDDTDEERGSSAMGGDCDQLLRLREVDGTSEGYRELYIKKNKYERGRYSIPLHFDESNAFFKETLKEVPKGKIGGPDPLRNVRKTKLTAVPKPYYGDKEEE